MKTSLFPLVLLFSLILVNQVAAGETIVLTLESQDRSINLTMSDLLAFDQKIIKTESPFYDGIKTYSGPKLEELLDHYSIESSEIILTALNDYAVTTTMDELSLIDPILAIRENGLPMSVRDKGPIWIMLPLSSRPDFDTAQYHRLMVWQLRHIQFN